MSAVAQWNNRETRRDDFSSRKVESPPTLCEIRSNSSAVRQNWSHSERTHRAQLAHLLQQQLLDRICSLPFEAPEHPPAPEASVV